MTLGNKIAELRKEKGITQEALANELGVSNQAVSKWEANQSCPDIQLLPQIADYFSITLDSLFGREDHKDFETEATANYDIQWEDDGKLRAVIYIGHKLMQAQDCTEAKEITFKYMGAALDVISSFSVTCNDVVGNVTANENATCDDVTGNISANGNVTCDNIEGNIITKGNVTCDIVNSYVQAGGNVTCDEINGNVEAMGNVVCDEVNGYVQAGGTVTCN